ncbi:MAG: hypothetical protein CVU41_16600 [Chloroflexi bacterium HGW-Chloroflexi-3]|nr:MAG: hypothetical protein CVU41_16600 [Chloroflexi bacterium HGW-Chloroflexi-3]
MNKVLIIFSLLIFLLSGCAEVILTPPVDRKTPLYESVGDYLDRTASEKAAIDIIINQYGYEASRLLPLKTTRKTWTDTCLEVAPISDVCVPEEIPGYFMLFYADHSIFEAHTDQSAQKIYVLNYLSKYSTPVEVAIQYLAKQLDIPTNKIHVQSNEQIDWPDSCLGVVSEDIVCVPVLTPGFLIQLEAMGVVFEFHADIYGSRLIPIQ